MECSLIEMVWKKETLLFILSTQNDGDNNENSQQS